MNRKVYLDHCVHSGLAKGGEQSWRQIGVGKVLSRAIEDNVAEVWTSPTEVLETLLCAEFDVSGNLLDTKKLDLRVQIAKM